MLCLIFLYVFGQICSVAALVIAIIHIFSEVIDVYKKLKQLEYDHNVRRALVRSRMDHFELTNEDVMKAIERIPGVATIKLETDYTVKSIIIYIHRGEDARRILLAVKKLRVSINPPMWIHFRW